MVEQSPFGSMADGVPGGMPDGVPGGMPDGVPGGMATGAQRETIVLNAVADSWASAAGLSPTAQAAVERAAGLLRAGRIVAFPTETVYGLGASAMDPIAVAAVYAAKGRPQDNPLIVHIWDESQIWQLASGVPPLAQKLIRSFWPGPLTILFRKRKDLPSFVTSGLDTVAIRCPSHPVAAALLKAAGIPVAAPSANRSGKPSPTCAGHVAADLGGRIDAILDGGAATLGLESTVVDATGDMAVILRPGSVTREDIENALGLEFVGPRADAATGAAAAAATDAAVYAAAAAAAIDAAIYAAATGTVATGATATDAAATGTVATGATATDAATTDAARPRSPGQKYRHYSPDAPMLLLDGEPAFVAHRIAMVVKAQETAFGADLLENGDLAAGALGATGGVAVIAADETLALVRRHLGGAPLRTSLLEPLRGTDVRPGNAGFRAGAAYGLYDALRRFDELRAGLILCERPRGGGIAEALRDRLERAAGQRVAYVGRVRELLFVCTGNTCRSCMAEALFRLRAEDCGGRALSVSGTGGVLVSSAGLAAQDGDCASANARAAIMRYGGDMAAHRARRLAEPMVWRADLTLTMTRSQRDVIVTRWPAYRHKVFCLTDFAIPPSDTEGIADPYNCGLDVYDACARSIRAAIDGVMRALRL